MVTLPQKLTEIKKNDESREEENKTDGGGEESRNEISKFKTLIEQRVKDKPNSDEDESIEINIENLSKSGDLLSRKIGKLRVKNKKITKQSQSQSQINTMMKKGSSFTFYQ